MMRALLFLVMGVGVAGFLLFGWRALHQAPPPPPPVAVAAPPPVIMVNVLVAAHDLASGTFLRPTDLSTISVAQAAIPAYAVVATAQGRSKLIGALVRHPILHETMVDPADLLLSGDHGFLAAILSPGMRAFTIPADQIVSNAGLIWPGDRLDLILTQQMPTTLPLDHQISGETVLTDLRVLAVDQLIVQPPPPDDATAHPAANGASTPTLASMTVEVSPADAERLAVALRLGKVALSIRPGSAVGKAISPEPVGTTWSGGVMHALTQVQPPNGTSSIHVYDGNGADKEYKF